MSFDSLLMERKYAELLSIYVERFKIVRSVPFTANFRCDLCGDSKKSKTKARAYVMEKDNHLYFKCHNCNEGHSLVNYLKIQHPNLHQQFTFELMSMKTEAREPAVVSGSFKDQLTKTGGFESDIGSTPVQRFQKFEPLKALKKISQLPDDNIARKYVLERKIPTEYHYKLFYVPKFFQWINSFIPNKFSDKALAFDSARLIIPFIDKDGYCFGVTGRSFDPEAQIGKYLTILFDETKPKIFGLDTVDFGKKVYITEGAIDSMFLKNALAFNGIDGDLHVVPDKVLVLDNEPRNKEVLDKYAAYIAQGYQICIWPASMVQKDINAMILAGYSPEYIQKMIDEHTKQGMLAQLAFNNWRRM